MYRLIPLLLLLLAFAGAPAKASDSIEAQVQEIERLGITAPWRESSEKINTLTSGQDVLSLQQRQRVEYVRLRNLALASDQPAALKGLTELLKQELPAPLRVRVYTTAISIAANLENWSLAFSLLNAGLVSVAEAPEESARFFSVASYLHTLVGETGRARELALQALDQIESGNDTTALCAAVSNVALAEEYSRNYGEAEVWRHRQIVACTRAGNLVYIANGKYGVGKVALGQGHKVEALKWGREALAEFETLGFVAGAYNARLLIAESLVESNRQLGEAEALLTDTLQYYQQQKSDVGIAESEDLLARLAEKRGDLAAALSHFKQMMSASSGVERSARDRQLAYLQVQFDTELKEQRIALLETERALAAAKVTSTKRWQLLLATGLIGLLVIAILLSVLLRRSFHARRRYRWQSEHDSLTRLLNYQQVRKRGEAALVRAEDAGLPFTAIVADIDFFKQVNDRYGHAAGDEALRSLGTWISETVGADGIAGRSGGDEFTILLGADAVEAEAMMQRLRARIEPMTVFGQTFSFNVSCGICQADARGGSLEQLIHEADRALYRAKHQGRDRVVSTSTLESAPVAGLVVVGSGIQFGRHVSERCMSEIREAQVVFCLADPFALAMISSLRPDTINLGLHYAHGKDRRQTYREIDEAIMTEVRAGKQVCAVFYGHPGVFADVPHRVIRKARAEGIPARMEPGISAEACLYADLDIDPGHRGVQSMEATQFLVYDRQLDPVGLVLLWQVALSGDLTCTRLHPEREGLQQLVDKLLRWYPPEHEVILYEAARLPIEAPRVDRLPLRDLASAHYEEYTTLVIPPLGKLCNDPRQTPGVESSMTIPGDSRTIGRTT